MLPLTKAQVFDIISRLESEIRALGVSRLAVFGSVARGETRPDSDVDILCPVLTGFEDIRTIPRLIGPAGGESGTTDRACHPGGPFPIYWILYLGGSTGCHLD